MSHIKFAISSHQDYIDNTFGPLTNSLTDAGVPAESVYWFVHRDNVDKYVQISPNYYLVPHNSIDFTGLVSVLELNLKNPWWFLLHDTTKVGPDFYKRLMNTSLEGETIPVSKHHVHPSANMGLYSWRYLDSNRETVLQYKNNMDDIHKFKTSLVQREDDLFKDAVMSLNSSPPMQTAASDVYGNGTPRIQEYFKDIDLYKIKANWKGYVDKWQVTP